MCPVASVVEQLNQDHTLPTHISYVPDQDVFHHPHNASMLCSPITNNINPPLSVSINNHSLSRTRSYQLSYSPILMILIDNHYFGPTSAY